MRNDITYNLFTKFLERIAVISRNLRCVFLAVVIYSLSVMFSSPICLTSFIPRQLIITENHAVASSACCKFNYGNWFHGCTANILWIRLLLSIWIYFVPATIQSNTVSWVSKLVLIIESWSDMFCVHIWFQANICCLLKIASLSWVLGFIFD